MSDERAATIHVSLWQAPDGSWTAETREGTHERGATADECLERLRDRLVRDDGKPSSDSITIVAEVTPVLAGVAEAAQVMGWDKRRVVTYIDRGRFPEPIQTLASGRIWRRSDIEAFAATWRARFAERRRARPGP